MLTKAVVNYNDRTVELDLSLDDIVKLIQRLGNTHTISAATKNANNVTSTLQQTINSFTDCLQISSNVKKNKFDMTNNILLVETRSEIKGRSDEKQSIYKLYQNKGNRVLTGIIETIGVMESESRKYAIVLGGPDNPSSDIGTISKAVNAMPFEVDFTKRKLAESLPANLARGNKIKLAMEYLKFAKIIEESKQKDFETGAKMYRRVKPLNEVNYKNIISV